MFNWSNSPLGGGPDLGVVWLQQGLPILDTEPVDPKLDGAFILLAAGIPVTDEAGVGIFDLEGAGILEAGASIDPSVLVAGCGGGGAAAASHVSPDSSLIFHYFYLFK